MSEPARPRRLGWGRLMDGGRLVPAFALVAVVSLVLGLVLARFIQPPAPASSLHGARAGFITATVERKTLRSEVVARADASFADAIKVGTPTGLPGAAIVTGSLPSVGDHVSALSVVAEVSGRPIILLPGTIPAYRTLSFGSTGSDVLQLKRALLSVGIDPGNPGTDTYDARTAAAVGGLYERVGYSPAVADGFSEDQLQSARDGVTAAQDSLASATRALAKAENALTPEGRLQQDNLVASAQRAEQSAQRALTAAQAAQSAANAAVAAAPNAPALEEALAKQASANQTAADASDAFADARDATALAIATRAAALASPDTSDEAAAVTSARHQLTAALAALALTSDGALPILPAGEVAFVSQLPRRVDSVTAKVGSPASGALLSLSGADLALEASVSPADSALLAVGDKASFVPADGGAAIKARVTAIEVASPSGASSGSGSAATGDAPPGSAGSPSNRGSRMTVILAPEGLSDAQVRALNGSNVRVTIPVGATAGRVLAVPIAAVSLGPGGTSRVQVVSAEGRASFVPVTTGLVAGGEVEVSAKHDELHVGDKVAVGR